MIDLYIGLPRSGKTTLITKHAIAALKRGQNVYTNIDLDIDSDHLFLIDNDDIGDVLMENGLLLIDEGEIFADSRQYKTFSTRLTKFFMLHGHYKLCIEVFTQRYKGVDNKIRNLCERLFLVKKFGPFSAIVPIKYSLMVPKSGEKQGEIVEGYRYPNPFALVFETKLFLRKPFYKYFDSFNRPLSLKPCFPTSYTVPPRRYRVCARVPLFKRFSRFFVNLKERCFSHEDKIEDHFEEVFVDDVLSDCSSDDRFV